MQALQEEGNSFSEFIVANVELGFDAQMSEWAIGHILAKYEGGDDDNFFIDEANIWLGNYEKYPLLRTGVLTVILHPNVR